MGARMAPHAVDYHDALAIGVARGAAPPDAGALALLATRARDLVSCVAGEPRRCDPEDVRMQEIFRRHSPRVNTVKQGPASSPCSRPGISVETSGWIAACSRTTRNEDGCCGVDSADAAPGRVDRYVRDVLRIALLHGWVTIVGHFWPDCLGTSEAGAPGVFRTLLDAAAGSMSPLAPAPLQDTLNRPSESEESLVNGSMRVSRIRARMAATCDLSSRTPGATTTIGSGWSSC